MAKGDNKATGENRLGGLTAAPAAQESKDVLKRVMSAEKWTRVQDGGTVDGLPDGEDVFSIKEYDDRIVVVTTAGQKYNVPK